MAELSTEYIEAIKKLIFKGNDIENRTERHEYIQRSLAQFFRLLEFNVFPEYTVGCIHFDHTSDHNRDSEFRTYYGAVDLYVKAPSEIHIAVEFDNGTFNVLESGGFGSLFGVLARMGFSTDSIVDAVVSVS